MRCPCPDFDLYRHVLVTGGTGCGKTASVVLPLLAKSLACDSSDSELKPAILVIDVKGDMSVPLRRMAAENGREGDIIEISPDSNSSTNLLSSLTQDPFTGSLLLTNATYQRMGFADMGKDNGFWQVGMTGYVASALAWLRLLHQPCTAANLTMLLIEVDRFTWSFADGTEFQAGSIKHVTDALRKSGELSVNQVGIVLDRLRELRNGESKTRSNFISCLAQVTDALAHPLARIVTASEPTWLPEDWLRDGKILLVRLPFGTYPSASNFIVRLIKLTLFRLILSRFDADMAGVRRSAFLFMDEAHRFVTSDPDSGDQNFIDRCRAMKTGCVFATQSIAALSEVFRDKQLDTFMANINTRVFGCSLDQTTTALATSLLGDVDMIRDYRGVRIEVTPDPDPDMPPQPTFSHLSGGDRRIAVEDIARLKVGEFYVAEGPEHYLWEATLPAFGQEPLMSGSQGIEAMPCWKDIPELESCRNLFEKSPRPIPAPEISPIPSPQPESPRPEAQSILRPRWMKPRTQPAAVEDRE